MRFENAYIPLDGAWCSPFVRWQGPAAELSSLDVAAQVTERALREREHPWAIDELVLGLTVPQRQSFYGAPTLAARLGLDAVSGPLIMQACATSVACVHAAAAGGDGVRLVVVTDRTSNGPHVVYPAPGAPGGTPAERELGAGLVRLRPEHRRGDAGHGGARRGTGRVLEGRDRRGDRAALGASTRMPCATTVPSNGAGWSRSPPGPSASRSRSTPTGGSAPRRWRRWKPCPRSRRAASCPTARRPIPPTAARA